MRSKAPHAKCADTASQSAAPVATKAPPNMPCVFARLPSPPYHCRVFSLRTLVFVLSASPMFLLACSVPPRSPQQALRDLPPTPVVVTGVPSDGVRLGSAVKGAEVAFGDVFIRVEDAQKVKASDITKPSVDDAVAMLASNTTDLNALAAQIRHAAAHVGDATTNGVRVGAGIDGPGGARVEGGTTVKFGGPVAERVRAQSSTVERGAAKVMQATEMVQGILELTQFLGSITDNPNADTRLRIAADAGGVPHRATCTLQESKLIDQRPGLSCTIVRADTPPTTVWHLNVGTGETAVGQFPTARGWLRAEPTGPSRPNLWITRPDGTVNWLARTKREDYTAFALQREQTPAASLRVRDTEPPAVWFAPDMAGLDEEARNALSIALALLALPPWQMWVAEPKP
jgi:hypothetical protein